VNRPSTIAGVDWKWLVATVLPVLTLILGALLNRWSEARGSIAQLEREATLRNLERVQARIDRRETFELTHLVDLHAMLNEMFKAAMDFHISPDGSAKAQAGEQLSSCNQRFTAQKGLILDQRARETAVVAQTRINEMAIQPPEPTHMHVQQALIDLTAALDAIATRLRTIYGEADEGPTRRPFR
jgi:hypothetical protein